MGEYFKKYTGGLAFMFSVLFLLIGLTKYEQIFSSTKKDAVDGIKYVQTTLYPKKSSPAIPNPIINAKTFSLKDNGEIMKVESINDEKKIYHYRAISVPELINNYEYLPILKLEILNNKNTKFINTSVYKIDRKEGFIFFLLKTEIDNKLFLQNPYTGKYTVELVK